MRSEIFEGPEGSRLTLAAVGDCLIGRKLSVYNDSKFMAVVKLLRETDVTLGNMEFTLHNYEYPSMGKGIFHNTRADPAIADEMKWLGFNLLSVANNHMGDYTADCCLGTARYLEAAGIVVAGAGINASEAREPRYLATNKGRVGFIATDSSLSNNVIRATEQRPDTIGRPGINGFRFSTTYIVTQEVADAIIKIAPKLQVQFSESGEEFTIRLPGFNLLNFKVGDRPRIQMDANKRDFENNIRAVKQAKGNADWCFVSIHSHEAKHMIFGNWLDEPAEFVYEFAHACIDAGADGFVGHGTHSTRGIEIYRGKPIFYDLGNFIATHMTIPRVFSNHYESYGLDPFYAMPLDWVVKKDTVYRPADREIDERYYHYTFLPVTKFEDGVVSEMKLYPIMSLPHGSRLRWRRGRPLLADGEIARIIMRRAIRLSKLYGTEIEYKNGVGIVKIPE